MDKPIRVLVVDDSALMRNLISTMLKESPEIEVPAIAMNGKFAIQKIQRYDFDVMTLDLEMPEMNGIEFLKEKKRLGIEIPVIVLSSIAKKGAQITMEALSLGAADFLLKPSGSKENIKELQRKLIEVVKIYGTRYQNSKKSHTEKTEINRQEPSKPFAGNTLRPIENILSQIKPFSRTEKPQPIEPIKKISQCETADIIVIGISTGGPNALRKILPDLDKNLPLPILIVQHMPAGFTAEFARSLDKICPLDVKEATEGDVIRKGRIFIAPGGKHLLIDKKPLSNIIKLSQTEAVNGHRPSADVLFASAAEAYNGNCIAVIMTGMGKDGVKEIGTIYQKGGITVAQDEDSCIVPGMPKGAINNGVIDHIVPLTKMADKINELAFKFGKK